MRPTAVLLFTLLSSSFSIPIAGCGGDVRGVTAGDAAPDAALAPDASGDQAIAENDAGATDAALDGSDADHPDVAALPDAMTVADTGLAADAETLDGTQADGSPDADANDAAGEDAGTAQLRVANASADSSLTIDFCVGPSAASFTTPWFYAAQPINPGIPRTEITEYLTLPASSYVLRVVAAGATTCTTPVPGADDLTFDAQGGTSYTVALLGSSADGGAHPLALRLYEDEPAPSSGLVIPLRFVHAAPSAPPIDVTIGPAPYALELQAQLAYGGESSAATAVAGSPIPDAAGYVNLPLTRADLMAAEGSEPTVGFGFTDDGRGSRTAFYLDDVSGGKAWMICPAVPYAPILAWRCDLYSDGAPQASPVQFVHLAPDAPAVDVCARVSGIGSWVGPLLATSGIASGITYLEISGPAPIPTGTDTDLAWVPAGSPCTATPIAQGLSGTYNSGPVGVLDEDWIGAEAATYVGGCLDPHLESSATQAFISTVEIADNPPQLTYTPAGGTAQPLGLVQTLDPGTYSIGGAGAAFSVTLAASEESMWVWYSTGPQAGKLARCNGNVGTLPAGTTSTCAD